MKRPLKTPQPPGFARRLFGLLAGRAHVDDLLGDMDEWFYENLRHMSLLRARWIYWKQVFSLSFSYALRARRRNASHAALASSSLNTAMLVNYFKVAVRNLYQHKYFSVINAFGLALGMSVSLLLIALFSYVSNYDDFHDRAEDVYAITSIVDKGIEHIEFATAPIALADKMTSEFHAADRVLTIVKEYQTVVTRTQNFAVKTYYTSPEFFDVFSFEFLDGSALALRQPGQVLLTETTARRLFGDEDPMGKTLELSGGALVQVSGVLKDLKKTHLNFDMLMSYPSIVQHSASFEEDWVKFPNQYVYVRMLSDAAIQDLEQYLDAAANRLYTESPAKVSFTVRPLKGLTVGPDLRNDIGEKWEASGFIVFAVFAALILLPACFNYANISVARAMRRAKEIALRKTVGGVRSQIFFQFVTETVLMSIFSLIGAIGIFVLIRREFQSMLVAGASLDLSLTPSLILLFVLFAIVTGVLAGIFPALYFARLNPIDAFKSRVVTKTSIFSVRKVLTIFQFVLSFGFILTLFAINRQYRYAMSFDFGFRKGQIIDVALQDVKREVFDTKFGSLANVETLSHSSGVMAVTVSQAWYHDANRDSVIAAQMYADRNYFSNLELTFVAGQSFPDESFSRESYMIVNEEFLKSRNISPPQAAIGRVYQVDGHDLEVIGVLKNFHYAPLNFPIANFVFRDDPSQYHFANLKVTGGDSYEILSEFETIWKQFPTEKKIIARYFEDEMREGYDTYVVMLKIVGFLGLMAITISLLGMIGMVVYTSQSRTKEVGIRKVMGADVRHMIMLLSGDYMKMLAWAIAIGTPLTVLFLNAMVPRLQHYHASISILDVFLSIVVLLVFGVGTIVLETYKTAVANPATTLRSE
ncbi:ABC transporter permease [Chryseolinea sp. T2]|uniref:ABC transporter permease n=1 Tax=Chryseolinea sp. T2 TaxID=3129255 RepID=UPI0030776BA3